MNILFHTNARFMTQSQVPLAGLTAASEQQQPTMELPSAHHKLTKCISYLQMLYTIYECKSLLIIISTVAISKQRKFNITQNKVMNTINYGSCVHEYRAKGGFKIKICRD